MTNNAIFYISNNDKIQLKCLLYSLYTLKKNTNNDIYLLTTLSNIQYSKLIQNIFNIKIIYVDKYDSLFNNNLYCNQKFGNCVLYYKFLIYQLNIFKNYNKILYIDNDTIINNNIDSIFNIDIQEIGMVKDISSEICINFLKKIYPLFNKNIYYNAGIILFNNKILNKNKKYLDLLELAKNKFTYLDQDIFNIYFNNITTLPNQWNYMINENTWNSLKHNNLKPIITHYASSDKIKWLKINSKINYLEQILSDKEFMEICYKYNLMNLYLK